MPRSGSPPPFEAAARKGRVSGAFLSYGFRPFFLLAAAWAVAALLMVFAALAFGAWPADAIALGRWHGHEMLFGFAGAAIAGFLLTAVPTWTGTTAIRGSPLAALAVLWAAGRAAMCPWLGVQDTPWILASAAFFPALAIAIGVALVRQRNYRNFQFMLFLLLLAAADALFAADALGWIENSAFDPLRLGANLIMLMIVVVGGRIVPLFTRNALKGSAAQLTIRPMPRLEAVSLAAVAAVIAGDLVRQDAPVTGWLAILAAVAIGMRLARWHGHRTLSMPIVWVLHAGYAWIVVALALKAAWLLGGAPWAANWLHALTAGAFGTMILGVMTRVALGHTGRALVVAAPIAAAYVLVIAGAALRVFTPTVWPLHYVALMSTAVAIWAAAFAVFLVVYVPILLAPRADARA